MKILVIVAATGLFTLPLVALPQCPFTLMVTNPAPTGLGTLHQAILDANACVGSNRIAFNLPGPGGQTITPLGGLPPITDPVIIEGESQPGFSGFPLIEINGSASPTSFGLILQSSNCVVSGLVINRFAAPGGNGFAIGIFTPAAQNNHIYGCYLGTDRSGTVARPNGQGGVWIGLGATRNVIGVTDSSRAERERNLISGNTGSGFLIQGSGNIISGNYIGTDGKGRRPLGNSEYGIFLNNAANTLVQNNVISANGRGRFRGGNGIFIRFANATGNIMIGNRIGTTADGTEALGNTTSGIALASGAHNNRIGTDGDGMNDATEGNLISGNGNDGITIGYVLGDAPVFGTIIAGNRIGTDIEGQAARPNVDSGIYVVAGHGHRIGTDGNGVNDEVERNLISGNGRVGVTLDGNPTPTANVLIAGNYIGTDASGGNPLPNPFAGVLLVAGAMNNQIGGPARLSNRIAYNGTGVRIVSGTGNRISANQIFGQTGLGIDLGIEGITPNDALDADTGANQLQNFPILNPATGNEITGTLTAAPNSLFTLQFFASPTCDPNGAGEAFLGSLDVNTSSSGLASFSFTSAAASGYLTATATAVDGSTSEFSPCVKGSTRPNALGKTVTGLEDTPLVISLEGTDPDNSPLIAQILTIPDRGALFQFTPGGPGAPIQTPGTTVNDPARRVIFIPEMNLSGIPYTAFDFNVSDGTEASLPACLLIEIGPVNDCPVAVARVVPPAEAVGTNIIVIARNNASAEVLFDASMSWDVEGDRLKYQWVELPSPVSLEPIIIPDPKRQEELSQPPGCGRCEGKVEQLSLRYNGETPAHVRIEQKNGAIVFDESISPETAFTIVGTDRATFGDFIRVFVADLAPIELNTSCSKPIGIGLMFSDFIIVDGFSGKGGRLCQVAALPILTPETFAENVVGSRELFLGTHLISLTVSDEECLASTQLRLEVITPRQAIDRCLLLVQAANLDRKEERPLVESLTKAGHEFDKGKFKQGVKKLEAFVKKVQASVEKGKISQTTAQQFIDCVQRILAALDLS